MFFFVMAVDLLWSFFRFGGRRVFESEDSFFDSLI